MCAKRRMFNIELTETDRFLDLSNDAKLLYFYFGLNADDDGFVSKAKRIIIMLNLKNECLQELIDNEYLLTFKNNSLFLIKHWKINNEIRADRYTKSIFG